MKPAQSEVSPAVIAPNVEVACEAGLSYADDSAPGIGRRGNSIASFHYVDAHGKPVRDEATLDRIRKLAIPPAYTDVWISPKANGHIQATGRDARGRKQYRYHADWRATRDETKFARMAAFGRALPKIRAQVDRDLKRPGLPKEKVIATVVRLLERTLIRVGNDEYARTNKSFGLTTLRDRHVHFHGAEVGFQFTGKSGVKHSTGLKDKRLARIVKQCQEVPGQRLFQYYADDGSHCAVGSADVNAYLAEITGQPFTAKDFRTWAGTAAAAKALSLQDPPQSETQAKALMTTCVKATAGLLGNTPAVCRKAYIHPAVFDAFSGRSLPASFAKAEGDAFERALLRFLDKLTRETKAAPGKAPHIRQARQAA
ncbi:DNA topoisomerase IB [soil metagenome]